MQTANICEVARNGGRADQTTSVEFVHAGYGRLARLLLANDGKAVADAEHHGLDARVFRDEIVEGAKSQRVRVLYRFIDDCAFPQHVVDQDESVRTQPL